MNSLLSWTRRLAAGLLLASSLASAAGQHAITLYGEPPKYPAGFQHFDYVNAAAPKGGVLRQAGFGSFDSLNPFIDKGVAADDIALVYDTLTRKSLDEPFTEYGLLAESIERDPHNQWVRFRLRPQARFNDGKPVTADDVVFTFNTLMQDGATQYKAYYADVARVEAEDARTVRFDFSSSDNRELPLILGQLPVLPKHWWQGREFGKTSLEPPLGSGPYRVADVQAGRSLRLERVKDWWGKDLAINRGFYNFDALVFDYYRDNTVALEALKAGQFDFWQESSAKNWATAYDVPAVREGRLHKETLANGNPSGMQGFVFNLRRSKFADARVREAITLMFDFEWTNRQLFYGAYTRSRSYFDNSELAASGLPGTDELQLLQPWRGKVAERVFTDSYQPPVSDGSGILRDQRRRAFALLQEAGWKLVDDQWLDAAGKPLTIEFLLAQPEFQRIVLPFRRNLKSIGIELKIRQVDVSQYVNRLRSRDFDMVVGSFAQSSSPGNEQREYWHSSSADRAGSRNLIGLKDPAVDAVVEQLINADSRHKLVASSRALDRLLQWGFYVVPNWHIRSWRLAWWDTLQRPAQTPPYDYALYSWWSKAAAGGDR